MEKTTSYLLQTWLLVLESEFIYGPKKGNPSSDLPAGKKVLEVTSKMVQIPAGPTPRQVEPGSQTEQAPPSAVLHLAPEEMHGFRFLTISVAPRLAGLHQQLPWQLGSCGIKDSALLDEAGDTGNTKLCKLRCFPPVALAWDPTSGLHVYPNLHSDTLLVDSSPALWTSTGTEKTTVLLLLDPHCAYKASMDVSVTTAASRFSLLYFSQIVGFCVAVVFFALMRQAHARPIPSIPKAVDFTIVSIICYLLANGIVILLILVSQLVFYMAAYLHVSIKTRWQLWEGNFGLLFLQWFMNLSSRFLSLKAVRVLRANPLFVPRSAAIILSTFVHPALGLFVLLLSHALCCHSSLCNSLTTSFRSNARKKESDYETEDNYSSQQFKPKPGSPSKENRSSYIQAQEDIFHLQHGLLVLHILATLMFLPSLVSWLQRIGMHQSFPRFLDSFLCICLILHGIYSSESMLNSELPFPRITGKEVRLNLIYLIAGFYSSLSGMALEPYKVLYAMGAVGIISLASSVLEAFTGATRFGRRRHWHRH
ncbi:Hydrolase acting on ester bonds isoform 2 [Hibiscus syriacus]|uniref:Hydrolase acting on ester bonds isoform 2 n=1 Tax=Hibiscus syriacus TaxID=106335 RepID=A0A6A2XLN9_HIBSY|nr:Hydrolase acting on ester bonds isoform 2 [Hibiscus syriacus]